ncbi:MAG: glycosyltransferase [Cyclobacteriaceae bacterium]|nr:glycosyltransferase [Cyclobacteriaceae bacterium]
MNKKRVLIITYYWPPSGGGGVQRWLKMAKYLPQFGWYPIVFTPENPDFELRDESLIKDIPKEAEVIKLPIWEPFGLYKKLLGKKAVQQQGVVDKKDKSFLGRLALWIRGNWFIPDARVFWVRPAVNYLTKYLSANPVDVIVTTGPPHSMHLIGMEVKRRTGVKWVADFRDPWTDWDVLPQLNLGKRAWKYHKKLEHEVMHTADLVLTVTNRLSMQLAKTGGIPEVKVVTNGFDSEDFESSVNVKPDKFRIAHVGLLNEGRDPKVLWRVLEKLCVEKPDLAEMLEVILVGTVEQSVTNEISRFEHLREKVVVPDYMSHTDVLTLYANSAVLLLLVNNTTNSSWILPGKLFEYLSTRRPILAFGIPESDANDLLQQCGYSGVFSFAASEEEIENRIIELFLNFRKNEFEVDSERMEAYERKKLTGELVDMMEQLVS